MSSSFDSDPPDLKRTRTATDNRQSAKQTAEEAWKQLDSQARLLLNAIVTHNVSQALKHSAEIGRLFGFVLIDEDETARRCSTSEKVAVSP